MRRDGRVDVDRSVKLLNEGVSVRVIMRLAVAVPHTSAVVRITYVWSQVTNQGPANGCGGSSR